MKPITLMSKDGVSFKVDMSIYNKFVTIRTMLEDVGQENTDDEAEAIPLPNVLGDILEKIIEWATYHKNDPKAAVEPDDVREKRTDDVCDWDKAFFKKFEQHTLFDLMLAANYLDIKELLDVLCKTVANMIKGKSPDEIRETFKIVNDFTPEEEEKVHLENQWCEEK